MDKDLDKSCEICMRYKRPSLRQVLEFSSTHDFNETTTMDLKLFRSVFILHMVDHATRYKAATNVNSKQKKVVIDKISQHWMTIFGTLNLFHSVNGGKFNNELFREMGEQLNINIKTTAAESPWSKWNCRKAKWNHWEPNKKSDVACRV